NPMFMVVLLPGAIVIGNWTEGTVNRELSTEAEVIIRFPPEGSPVFDTWTVLFEVVLTCTVPKSKGVGRTEIIGAAVDFELDVSKSANAVCEPLITIVQVEVPLQAPDQPLKTEMPVGTAVSVTDVPSLKLAAHWVGHSIPAGLLATLPVPVPVILTNNGWTRTKFAVTDCAAVMDSVQGPLPEQAAALQPAKAEPDCGDAESVTEVALSYLAVHVAPQEIPVGELVTVPVPVPAGVMVTAYCGGG